MFPLRVPGRRPVAGAVGIPLPGMHFKLIDDDGQEVGTDTPGELLCKGVNLMKGYFENPKATAEYIFFLLILLMRSYRDGWFCTGDVATVSKDGIFTILDRKKELLKFDGFQIAPGMTPFLQD